MDICDKELENILTRVHENDLEEIKKAALSKDFLKIKNIMKKYVSSRECLTINLLTKYVVKKILIESVEMEDKVLIEVPVIVLSGNSMASGLYPCYTIAEVIYASLFDIDSSTAHEKMYDLIEPILLSPNFTINEKRGLFLPVTMDNWDTIQNILISILSKLDDDSRKAFCSNLSKLFHLFFTCFDMKYTDRFIVKTYVFGKLFNLCPDLKYILIGEE
ncbi:MAG: hypothetical protein QXU08_05800 [Ignisphaera sp.]